MKVFQIVAKVFLLEQIKQQDALNVIASYLDSAMVSDSEWRNLHMENCYKDYCYSAFSPVEKDGVYKGDQLYSFKLRTVDERLAEFFLNRLPRIDTPVLKGLVCDVQIIPRRHITELYSLTPVIVKGSQNHYWRDELSFEEFENRLKINLIKKYQRLTGEKMNEEFELHTLIEFVNRKPIAVPYKNVKLLADKVQMQISDHTQAQDLAYMSLGTGLAEMNARGMGYVNFHFAE